MLTERVEDRSLAWCAADLRAEALECALGADAAGELLRERDYLARDPAAFRAVPCETGRFQALARAVESVRRGSLGAYGAAVVRGSAFGELSEVQRVNAFWVTLCLLGEPIAQNDEGARFVVVRDEGQRMAAGGRYHKSNEGGELHTDAPQFESPPRYVGLQCVHPAAEGGASKLVSAHAVHNVLLAEAPELLARLYEPFHFHRKPTTRTVLAPVFSWDARAHELRVRYLGEYVRSGHRVAGIPLGGTRAEAALDALDRILADEARFAVEFSLGPGDVLLFENHRVFHGRSAFRDHDHDGGGPRRELNRVWVTERASGELR